MADSSRTGRTANPDAVITGRTVVPGQSQAGLDQMLEVVEDSPGPMAAHSFLLVVSGADPGRLHVLDRPEMVIGRSKYADIQIGERALSAQHAKIVRVGDLHRIYDLGSTNGTYVNDQRVEQADLRVGDVVQTGETVFTYMASSAAESGVHENTMALPQGARRGAAPAPSVMVRPRMPLTRPASPPTQPQYLATPQWNPPADDGPDLLTIALRVVEFFRRYWLSILLLTMLGGTVGAASYKFIKPPAEATFELELVPVASDNPIERVRRMNFEFFRAAVENFTRPSLIHQTLKEMGETEITSAQLRSVQDRLALKPTRGAGRSVATVYAGSYTADTPEEAVNFLRVHLEGYLEQEIDKALQVLVVEVDMLEEKLKEAERDLNAQEQAILAFKEEHSEGLPEQAQQFYQELIGLGSERGLAASEVARTATELEISRKRLRSETPLIESRIQMARPYEEAISDVKKQLASARAEGKGSQHPAVVALQAQLEQLEQLRDEVMAEGTQNIVRSKNPIYEDARRAVDNAEAAHQIALAELGRLTNDLKRTEKIVTELPRLQQEYSELTRSYDATKAIHNNLFEKLTSSKIQLDMERASASARFDVITPPNVVSPSVVKTIIIRGGALAIFGFVLGVSLGLVRDLRRIVAARMAAMRARA